MNGKSFGNLGTAGKLGVITAGIGIASTIIDSLDSSGTSQEEIDQNFENAVDEFVKAVDNFSTSQSIDLANLLSKSSSITSNEISSLYTYDVNNLVDLKIFGKQQLIDYIKQNYALELTKEQLDALIDKADHSLVTLATEINNLISSASEENFSNIKESLGVSSSDFTSSMITAFSEGGDVYESVNDMMYDAVVKAFLNQTIFENLNSQLGNLFTNTLLGNLEGLNLNTTLSSDLGVAMQQYSDIYGAAFETLADLLDSLGLSASSASDSLDSLSSSSSNVPSYLKTGTIENTASSIYNSGTTYNISTVYGTVDKSFVNQIQKQIASTQYNRTGN